MSNRVKRNIGISVIVILCCVCLCKFPLATISAIVSPCVTILGNAITADIFCYITFILINIILCALYIYTRIYDKKSLQTVRLADAVCVFNIVYIISYAIRDIYGTSGWWSFLVFSAFYIVYFVAGQQYYNTLIHILLLVFSVEFIIAIVFYVFNINQFITPGFGQRTSGTYHNPNTLYPLCLLAFPIALQLANMKTSVWARYVYYTIAALSLIALILTFQRAGWIALAVAGVYLAFTVRGWFHSKRVLSSVIVIAILLFAGALFLRTNGKMIGNKYDRSTLGRIAIWNVAFHIFVSRPIFGYGQGTYQLMQRKSMGESLDKFNPMNDEPKSLILLIAIEFGVIGVLSAIFIVFSYCKARRRLTADKNMRCNIHIVNGIDAALMAVLIAGFVDTPILYSLRLPSTIFALVLIAIIAKMDAEIQGHRACSATSFSRFRDVG